MTNSEIFKSAWATARESAKRFGGKASEYFAEALKMVYKMIKHMKNYTKDYGKSIDRIVDLRHQIADCKNKIDKAEIEFEYILLKGCINLC